MKSCLANRSGYWSGNRTPISVVIGPAIGHMCHMRIYTSCMNERVILAWGSVFVLRIAMDVSDEASSEVEPSGLVSFSVGDTFSSYDDLKKKLAEFEKSQSVQLTQRDSRTLEAAARRVPKRVKNANTALVYYSINFSCVLRGKEV